MAFWINIHGCQPYPRNILLNQLKNDIAIVSHCRCHINEDTRLAFPDFFHHPTCTFSTLLHRGVCFASFLSGEFITAKVVNPPESKRAKRTSVQCIGLSTTYMTISVQFQNVFLVWIQFIKTFLISRPLPILQTQKFPLGYVLSYDKFKLILYLVKGQLISKCLFGVFTFFKKKA